MSLVKIIVITIIVLLSILLFGRFFICAEELMFVPTYAPSLSLICRSARLLSSQKPTLSIFIGIALLVGASSTLFAQTPNDDDVIRVNTNLLLFPIRVKDKRGQPVEALKETDLRLRYPDGVTSGLYFSAGVDRVALVFALDQSGSLKETIAQQQTAALGLFARFSDRSSVAVDEIL